MRHPLAVPKAASRGLRRCRRAAVRGFRHWRWSRPFWGGLFLVAAGAEILAAPTAQTLALPDDLLLLAALAGSSHYLIGALSVVNGLLSWARPDHHAFHGAVGVLLALASFTTSNFGGFLVGMLLGVVGGSLVFAWSADTGRGGAETGTARRRSPRRSPRPSPPAGGLAQWFPETGGGSAGS